MESKSRFSRIKKRHKLLALAKILRLQNLGMIALSQILVGIQLFEIPFWQNTNGFHNMLHLVLATAFSAASGYLINDYYDVKIDIVNKPKRVVVGRTISRRQTMILHLVFIFLALLISYPLGKQLFAVIAFCSAWLWLYSNRLKRMPLIGNVSVSLLTAISVYLPSLVFPNPKESLVLFSIFAFWISLIREIVKDMEDMKGDARHGCHTLPIIWGIRKTKMVLYGVGFLFALSFGFSLFSLPKIWIAGAIGMVIPLGYLFFEIYKADTVKSFSKVSLICKWIMLLGIGSMVLA